MKGLEVRNSPGKGRGVFAERDFAKGDLITRCPAVVLNGRFRGTYGSTVINSYHFNWIPGVSDTVALALGYGSLFNHSWTPNADWVTRIDENMMDFIAQRRINAGEEITVHYKYAADVLPPWYDEGRPEAEGSRTDALTQSPGGSAVGE